MALPHVYPDFQPAPLTVAANSQSGPGLMTIEISASATVMRLVQLGAGATDPHVVFKADTGDEVEVSPNGFPFAIFNLPGGLGGGGTEVLDVEMTLDDPVHKVYKLALFFQAAASFSIRIKNPDLAASHDYTWVVAVDDPTSQQPWIDVEPGLVIDITKPTTLIWDVLINGSEGESVQIMNKGTGPFTVSSVTPALPMAFALGPLPSLPLNPGDSQPLTVTFTGPPTPPGPDGFTTANPATVNITPADPNPGTSVGHNQQLLVSARTQALEVVLLLDDSGSMTWEPASGNTAIDVAHSRWGELLDAVNNNFLYLLAHFGNKGGNFGIAKFPEDNPLNPTTFDVVPMTAIPDKPGMGSAITKVANVTPFFGGTPMGDGIDHVFSAATSYFATDALSVAANRRWLLMMTDGAQNAGTHQPTEYILPPGGTAVAPNDLFTQNIEMFAIGYGVNGASNVNPALLTSLAGGSYNLGQTRFPDQNGLTATQIAGAFRDALKAGLTQSFSPGDPPAVFHAGQGEVRHFAQITKHDDKAAFVLAWNTPDAQRMRLELITPTCDVITPESAAKGVFKDVFFVGGDRSQMYLIDPGFIRNTDNPAQPRYGTWTLRVLSPELSDSKAGVENYDYDIIVESDLRMDLKLDRPIYYAGDPIQLTARLTAAGRPIQGASVTLSTTAPQQSEANWLAGLNVPAEFLKQAGEKVKGDTTPLLVKAVGAQLTGMSFFGGTNQTNSIMTDPGNVGNYQAAVTDTSTPENRIFYVTATGVTDDGSSFRREGKIVTNVLVRPDPNFTYLDVQFGERGTAQVVVIPRDSFGNVLLVDPGTYPRFGLTVQNGSFVGSLNSNLNGSYNQTVKFDPGATPVISVIFDGKPIQQQTLPPVANLKWVDKVVAFVPGAEAAKGANQHANPADVLGNLLTKPAGTFVSLGGHGSITVRVDGQMVIAQGDDDITVFVQPDNDLRAYLVEVLPAEDDAIWVTLGTAPGTPSSFSLSKAGLSSASAIRITDKSGRTRDSAFKPLATPGVSIRAVGVKSVGEGGGGNGGDGDICIRIRALNPQGQPLGGTVDIEFQPQEGSETTKIRGVDASKDIDVKGLARFPQVNVYEVTVTPTDVFKPTSQFLTIPASGFNTVVFVINKGKKG